MKKTVFLFLLLIFSQISTAQKTILWKVTDTVHHKTSVLLGTFHLFGNSFVDSIPEIEKYLSQSELVIFESVDKVDHIRNMINSRESSTEISKKIKKKDLEKLLKISKDWKVDIYKLKPVELRWKLEQVFIRSECGTVKKDDTWDHFDKYLQHLAEEYKLRLVGLETGKQQLRFIERENKFPDWKDEKRRISYLLDQISSNNPDQRNCELADKYRKFDLDYKFDQKCSDNILIKERNDIWMRILPDLLKTNNCFVAVGLFHLYKECGLLNQLKRVGFVVEPVSMGEKTKEVLKTSEIRVRDPFILADQDTKTYYLYASIQNRSEHDGQGVEVYTSKDLQNWTQPRTVFKVPENFWATKWVWAPEVHFYMGKYYLFTTLTSNELLKDPSLKPPSKNWPPFYKRGTQVLVADSPEGPFKPFANKPHTPPDQMALDGTPWVENGQPYMVYCHEWVQIKDGTVNLISLKEDLSAIEGEDQILFKASEAPWVKAIANGKGYITDGCFLYRTKTDKLLMIWSSAGKDGYAIGSAVSESGSVKGPWKHQQERLFKRDGGHGMIFKTFNGQLTIVLHQPNVSPKERMQFYKLKDIGNALILDGKL